MLSKNNLLSILLILGAVFIVSGLGLVSQAWAVNSTAITETLDDLRPNSDITGAYHTVWIIFFLLSLVISMAVMFRMRESKEASFFSLLAVIFSIVITILLVSPVNFDIQTETTVILVTANDTQVTEASVSKTLDQIILMPFDSDMRLILSMIFTGITLFNGLYTIFILTNFRFSK